MKQLHHAWTLLVVFVCFGACLAIKGGEATFANTQRADPGSGRGGVVITSTNGILENPPRVSCAAGPVSRWPANGKAILVAISGTVIAGTQPLTSSGITYAVTDQNGDAHATGSVRLAGDRSYSFQVRLVARRGENIRDGRTYTITIRAKDKIGNCGYGSAIVKVPGEQSK